MFANKKYVHVTYNRLLACLLANSLPRNDAQNVI